MMVIVRTDSIGVTGVSSSRRLWVLATGSRRRRSRKTRSSGSIRKSSYCCCSSSRNSSSISSISSGAAVTVRRKESQEKGAGGCGSSSRRNQRPAQQWCVQRRHQQQYNSLPVNGEASGDAAAELLPVANARLESYTCQTTSIVKTSSDSRPRPADFEFHGLLGTHATMPSPRQAR